MRILFVARAESIHTARWVCQVADQGWELHLFPSYDTGAVHPDLRNITVHHSFYGIQLDLDRSVRLRGFPVIFRTMSFLLRGWLRRYFSSYRVRQLRRLIAKTKPDVIHAMEIQGAGYLTQEALKGARGGPHSWLITNWGSDIYLFGRLPEHDRKIREVLKSASYYSCECERDVELARLLGFTGKIFPVCPNAGGFDLKLATKLRRSMTSERRGVMLKGYQHFAGRALVGLRALERCADILQGYHLYIYSTSPDTELAARLFQEATGVRTTVVPNGTQYDQILALHGQARISIGVSISDAASTSLLEALVMGSFPIQSWTACANEWVKDGETGRLVPPEDPEVIEDAIRQALADDELVDRASEKNYRLAEERLDRAIVQKKAVAMYRAIAEGQRSGSEVSRSIGETL